MQTIQADINIAEDRKLFVQLPSDIKPGPHHLLLVIDEISDSGSEQGQRLAKMRSAKGIWKGRDDIPSFDQIRKSWDRNQG